MIAWHQGICDMEPYYRMTAGIIYFFQMAALSRAYRKTGDQKILCDSASEPAAILVVRVVWVVAVIASIFLYVAFPSALRWGTLPLGAPARIFGIVAGIATDLLILWILRSLGKSISAALKIRDGQRLVTEGPYRYVRHPLYGAGILLFFSLALISANWFLGLVGIGFQLFVMLVRTPLEERMLIDHFGEEYQCYMKHTGAYFPRGRQ